MQYQPVVPSPAVPAPRPDLKIPEEVCLKLCWAPDFNPPLRHSDDKEESWFAVHSFRHNGQWLYVGFEYAVSRGGRMARLLNGLGPGRRAILLEPDTRSGKGRERFQFRIDGRRHKVGVQAIDRAVRFFFSGGARASFGAAAKDVVPCIEAMVGANRVRQEQLPIWRVYKDLLDAGVRPLDVWAALVQSTGGQKSPAITCHPGASE